MIQSSGVWLELVVQRKARPASSLGIDNLPPGDTFIVELEKQKGALGLRISGGKDKVHGSGEPIVCEELVPGREC